MCVYQIRLIHCDLSYMVLNYFVKFRVITFHRDSKCQMIPVAFQHNHEYNYNPNVSKKWVNKFNIILW